MRLDMTFHSWQGGTGCPRRGMKVARSTASGLLRTPAHTAEHCLRPLADGRRVSAASLDLWLRARPADAGALEPDGGKRLLLVQEALHASGHAAHETGVAAGVEDVERF
jgi:hypothetical protein